MFGRVAANTCSKIMGHLFAPFKDADLDWVIKNNVTLFTLFEDARKDHDARPSEWEEEHVRYLRMTENALVVARKALAHLPRELVESKLDDEVALRWVGRNRPEMQDRLNTPDGRAWIHNQVVACRGWLFGGQTDA